MLKASNTRSSELILGLQVTGGLVFWGDFLWGGRKSAFDHDKFKVKVCKDCSLKSKLVHEGQGLEESVGAFEDAMRLERHLHKRAVKCRSCAVDMTKCKRTVHQ